ncbi:hypothetical protein EJB05_18519, partial [Eragrostis curvula]
MPTRQRRANVHAWLTRSPSFIPTKRATPSKSRHAVAAEDESPRLAVARGVPENPTAAAIKAASSAAVSGRHTSPRTKETVAPRSPRTDEKNSPGPALNPPSSREFAARVSPKSAVKLLKSDGPPEELKDLIARVIDLLKKQKRETLNWTMHAKARIHADPALEFDQFDCLPDSLVLLILNKLEDVRSLGRCSAVSKRFSGLVPLVHDVCVKIDRVITVDGDSDDGLNLSAPKPRNIISHFLKLMLFTITKPFHDMRNPNGTGRPLLPQLAHHSPVQVLKNFSHVRNLRVELPSGDVGVEEGVLLKWRAEYGSSLQNCVILGGTLVDRKPVGTGHEQSADDNGCMPESFYTNGGLKLRVVWTISCLIAASTRHYLLRSIIKDHPTLRSLVLADADGQGTLCMGTEQLKEFRENQLSASACSNRTQVPACNMKLKYAPYLELPGGLALQGATLLVIKPANDGCSGGHGSRKETEAFVSSAFDGPLSFAVKALMKRRTYLLEMNGF